ncbi:hypothetical protein FHS86_002295 [Roseimarinus sediminis]
MLVMPGFIVFDFLSFQNYRKENMLAVKKISKIIQILSLYIEGYLNVNKASTFK